MLTQHFTELLQADWLNKIMRRRHPIRYFSAVLQYEFAFQQDELWVKGGRNRLQHDDLSIETIKLVML